MAAAPTGSIRISPWARVILRRSGSDPILAPRGSFGRVPSDALRSSRRTSAGARNAPADARVIACSDAAAPAMIADAPDVPPKNWYELVVALDGARMRLPAAKQSTRRQTTRTCATTCPTRVR